MQCYLKTSDFATSPEGSCFTRGSECRHSVFHRLHHRLLSIRRHSRRDAGTIMKETSTKVLRGALRGAAHELNHLSVPSDVFKV